MNRQLATAALLAGLVDFFLGDNFDFAAFADGNPIFLRYPHLSHSRCDIW